MKNLLAGILCIIFVLFLGGCKDGKDGEAGLQGERGWRGLIGPTGGGIDGIPGVDGVPGINGVAGPTGPPGIPPVNTVTTFEDVMTLWTFYKADPVAWKQILENSGALQWHIIITKVEDAGRIYGDIGYGSINFQTPAGNAGKVNALLGLDHGRPISLDFHASWITNINGTDITLKGITWLGKG